MVQFSIIRSGKRHRGRADQHTSRITTYYPRPYLGNAVFLTSDLHPVILQYEIFSSRRLHNSKGGVQWFTAGSGEMHALDMVMPVDVRWYMFSTAGRPRQGGRRTQGETCSFGVVFVSDWVRVQGVLRSLEPSVLQTSNSR